ncbi:MAG: RNA polymerase sigma factor [Bacteroidales bacterium]
MSDYSDKELLVLFKNQEKRNYAFNLIVRKYQEKLYWHIRKIVLIHDDADDILQNTFIKVWKGLDGFREDSKLYTWLYRIATNESLTFLKQKKTKYLLPIVDYENQLEETLESDDYFNGNEIQMKLQKAILILPEKQRIVFNLKYFEEMKYDDMAKVLNTSVGALKASYHHAVKKIEKYFNED